MALYSSLNTSNQDLGIHYTRTIRDPFCRLYCLYSFLTPYIPYLPAENTKRQGSTECPIEIKKGPQ